jgi:superfamily II helicase
MKTTKYGVKYDVLSAKMVDTFEGYDYAVASCHINNYGVIIVDEYGSLIDNEYVLEDIFES